MCKTLFPVKLTLQNVSKNKKSSGALSFHKKILALKLVLSVGMNEKTNMTSPEGLDLKSLKKTVIVRFVMLFPLLGLLFFLPAGTLNYWEAWVYIFVTSVPTAIMIRYLYKYDPKLLERRMRTKERQKTQKWVVSLAWLFFLPTFIIPGFDRRFEWSHVPLAVIVISFLLVLSGYLLFALVLKTNSYASRVIEVEKGQKVISTGPYAIVRHPMYLAVLILYVFSPLALGSYWAMLPLVLLLILLVVRIKGEEKELLANLEGYKEYVMRTKYRLLPRIW